MRLPRACDRGVIRGVLLCLLVSAVGCRFEDHTPAGNRADEAAIRSTLYGYYVAVSAGNFARARAAFRDGGVMTAPDPVAPDVALFGAGVVPVDTALARLRAAIAARGLVRYEERPLRIDVRQDDDVASGWVTLHRHMTARSGGPSDREVAHRVVLRRVEGGWRIESLAVVGGL